MASSSPASFLACLSAFADPEKCPSLPLCWSGRGIVNWKSKSCLRFRRRAVERPTSLPAVIPSTELEGAPSGEATTRRSPRKSTELGVACGHQSEADQSLELELVGARKTERSRSARKDKKASHSDENIDTKTPPSRKKRTEQKSVVMDEEVRSVTNAEDSSDEGIRGSLDVLAIKSNDAVIDPGSVTEVKSGEIAEGNSTDVLKRIRKLRPKSAKPGRKPTKTAMTDELPDAEHVESLSTPVVSEIEDTSPQDDINNGTTRSFDHIDVEFEGGIAIVPTPLHSSSEIAHKSMTDTRLHEQSTISPSVVMETPSASKRVQRKKRDKTEMPKQRQSRKVDVNRNYGSVDASKEDAFSNMPIDFPSQKSMSEEHFTFERHVLMDIDEEPKLEDAGIRRTVLDRMDAWEGTEADYGEHVDLMLNGNSELTSLQSEERDGEVHMALGSISTGELYSVSMDTKAGKVSKVSKRSTAKRKQKTEVKAEVVKSGNDPPYLPGMELVVEQRDGLISSIMEPKQRSDNHMCVVRWLVEAQLNPNQLLFVVGANHLLGGWDPSLAIGFSEYKGMGQTNWWQAQSQVPFGTESEYNYFILVRDRGTDSIVWRPGPRLHLVIPSLKDMVYREIILQDRLDFNVENKLPALFWGGWWNEIGYPIELRRFLDTELAEGKRQDQLKASVDQRPSIKSLDSLVSMQEDLPHVTAQELGNEQVKQLSDEQGKWQEHVQGSVDRRPSVKSLDSLVSTQEDLPHVTAQELGNEQVRQLSEEVVDEDLDALTSSSHVEEASLVKKSQEKDILYSGKIHPKLKRFIRRKACPREEPWLIESMLIQERSEALKKAAAETNLKIEDSQSGMYDVVDSSLLTQEKADIPTEILINSSKCTMERIAILEEGKLVELLLEPVNSDIIVGNVYLGVVKKLLPGMTGVFVDIGHPRLTLLSINKNSYPFTFPPITAESNGSLTVNLPVHHLFEADGDATGRHEQMSKEDVQSLEKLEHILDEDLRLDGENEDEDGEEDEEAADEEMEDVDEMEDLDFSETGMDAAYGGDLGLVGNQRGHQLLQVNGSATKPITVNFGQRLTKWRKVEEGMKIIVQVKKEPLGKKGPKVSAFPQLASRFWVLGMRGKSSGVSKKVQGPERKRLKDLADSFRKRGYDLTARTEAAGQPQDDLEKDLMRLHETWKDIIERAEAASVDAENGVDDAVPALLHRAMGRTLSIVRDFFAENVHRMVVDSAQTFQEVTSYLQEVAPHLLNRVELYTGTMPIFDAFNLESEIDKLLSERIQLPNGAYLVIEETEALVSIDVNGGAGMLGRNVKSAVILEANLAAARQIAVQLRLRDIGGIIVIDFIDMDDPEHESLVYKEMRKAIQMDRSVIHISEISELSLMEVTRRRVRPSVTHMISDPCSVCHGTGRVESLETTLSRIERAILRLVATHSENTHLGGKTWLKVLLRVDPIMFEFLTRKQRATQLSSSLKVYIILKVGREMTRGSFEVTELNLRNEKRQLAEGHQRTVAHKHLHSSPLGKKGLASRT